MTRLRPRHSARCSARREDADVRRTRSRGRSASCSRQRGAARVRLRRHPLGRGDLPRPRRARRAALDRRADPARCAWPGRNCSNAGRSGRVTRPARAASGCGRRRADPGRRRAGAARARSLAPPAETRCSSTEMVAMAREGGRARSRFRPTLQALLAARLDQLDTAERSCSSEARSRERSSTEAPSRRCTGRRAGAAAARCARPQGARPARQARSCPATTLSASAIC